MERNDENRFETENQAAQPLQAGNPETPAPDGEFSAPPVRKYIDRSGESPIQDDGVSEGAVWHGPAYTPDDDEEERRRVRAIIEQNAAPSDAQEEEEENTVQPEKPPFWKRTWFILLCLVLLPPAGIILVWACGIYKPVQRAVLSAAGILLTAAIVLAAVHFIQPAAQPDKISENGLEGGGSLEETENAGPLFANYPDKSEDEIRAASFPRGESLPTPADFFTAKTAFSDYTYYYFYVNGTFTGYDAYAGTNYAIVETALGKIALLDAMFTLPDFEEGDEFFFYYLYIGYDPSLDAVFGAYVDHSVENEGKEQVTTYPAGSYTVGEDLEAGEYFFYPTAATASVQVYGDAKYIEKILSESFAGGYFLTLEDGEVLVVQDAQFSSAAEIELSAGSTLYAYMYRVGTDIEPGTYRLTPDGIAQARYILYDSSSARLRQAVVSEEFDEQIIMEAKQGQYLHLIHCYGASYNPSGAESGSEDGEKAGPNTNSTQE